MISAGNVQSSRSRKTAVGYGRSIAVTGKGGTGKTMLATLLIKILAENGKNKILAIDADSALSLPHTLGVNASRTVSDIRREIIEFPEAKRRMEGQPMRNVMAEAIAIGKGFDLLVMGRPEEPGCFCAVNELLRYGIDSLMKDYDFTIIDGEAGPEQINRRVLKSIDTLLVVADMSVRSLQTANTIIKVARGQGNITVERAGLILNRFREINDVAENMSQEMDLEILGYIPEDENVNYYDRLNKPLFELPAESPALMAVHQVLSQIM